MAAGFAGPYKGTQVTGQPLEIKPLGSDAVAVITEGGVIGAGESELSDAAAIRASWILVKRDGQWKLGGLPQLPARPCVLSRGSFRAARATSGRPRPGRGVSRRPPGRCAGCSRAAPAVGRTSRSGSVGSPGRHRRSSALQVGVVRPAARSPSRRGRSAPGGSGLARALGRRAERRAGAQQLDAGKAGQRARAGRDVGEAQEGVLVPGRTGGAQRAHPEHRAGTAARAVGLARDRAGRGRGTVRSGGTVRGRDGRSCSPAPSWDVRSCSSRSASTARWPCCRPPALLRLLTGAGRPVSDAGARLQPATAVLRRAPRPLPAAVSGRAAGPAAESSGTFISVDPQVGAVRHLELPGGRAGGDRAPQPAPGVDVGDAAAGAGLEQAVNSVSGPPK